MTSTPRIAAPPRVRPAVPRAALTTLALILSITANQPDAQANTSPLTPNQPDANQPEAQARASSHTPNQPEAQARATPDPTPRSATAGDIHPPGLPCGYTVEVIERPECPWPLPASLIWVQGMNEAGSVVGYRSKCIDDTWDQAWVWHPGDSTPTDLPVPPDIVSSQAYDINDNGLIVGAFRRFAAAWHGFVYDMNTGEWTELEPVDTSGSGQAFANAINNAGVVAGTRSIGESHQPYNAFTWSADDGYTDLGVMQGPNSAGRDINASGAIVGWTGNGTISGTGFHYHQNEYSLIGPFGDGTASYALSINDGNQFCGTNMNLDLDSWNGFIVSRGETISIDPLPQYDTATVGYLDEAGVVAGHFSSSDSNDYTPFVWRDGYAIVLNNFVEDIEIGSGRPRAMNGSGRMTLHGKINGQNSQTSLVLTPLDTLLGDLNGDCEVGAEDLGLLLSEWNKKNSPADLTGDGTIGGADLGTLLSNWTH